MRSWISCDEKQNQGALVVIRNALDILGLFVCMEASRLGEGA